jgi:hypothetical protein
MSEHNKHFESPGKLDISSRFYTTAGVLVAIGAIAFAAGLFTMPQRAWRGYLIGYWFTLSLAISGPFILATQYLTTAGWSVSIRRIPSSFGYFLPVVVVLSLGGMFGAEQLYHWLGPHALEDPHIKKLSGFLNFTGFVITTLGSTLLWTGLYFLMRRTSVKQDNTGDPSLLSANKRNSAIFLLVFVPTFSLMGVYWIKSLETHWMSMMFHVYTFASMFQAGLALTAVILIYLKERGDFGPFVGEKQVHEMGKFVFAFTVFWAYIAFCQFLLIWYANIPHGTSWFHHRIMDAGGWHWFTILFTAKFIVPFLVLLRQKYKKNVGNVLRYTCYFLIVTFLYENWFWVSFAPYHGEVTIYAPWLEFLITVGFVGLFMAAVGKGLSSANLIPEKDPFLHESIEHHHTGEFPEGAEAADH